MADLEFEVFKVHVVNPLTLYDLLAGAFPVW